MSEKKTTEKEFIVVAIDQPTSDAINASLKKQLREKEQQLAGYMDAIAVSITAIEFDLAGHILSANTNFQQLLGFSKH